MLVMAVIALMVMAVMFMSGNNAVGFFLFFVAVGCILAGLSELDERRKATSFTPNSPTNNIFFDHPIVAEILRMVEETGCCETFSFETEGVLHCGRRKLYDGDESEAYLDLKERKILLSEEEQCELLKILKYYLPNGDSYQIQAAYDVEEYEQLQESAKEEYIYSDGRKIKNQNYGKELFPERPKYYMMFTTFYQNKCWSNEHRRWEMPRYVYSPVESDQRTVQQ